MRATRMTVLVWVALAAMLPAEVGFTQSVQELERMRKDIDALKAGQQAIYKELREIKSLLRGSRQARRSPVEPVDLTLNIEGDPVKGNPDAVLMLVEFSDYECPFCARHFQRTLPRIDREYIQTGKLRYVFRDFPIERIHQNAMKASEAANCAGEQGHYWAMHDRLFANRQSLSLEQLPDHAEAIGLNMSPFRECLGSGRHAAEIREDLAEGTKAGITGTPAFFLGFADEAGTTVHATRRIQGALPFEEFQKAINSLLDTGTGTK